MFCSSRKCSIGRDREQVYMGVLVAEEVLNLLVHLVIHHSAIGDSLEKTVLTLGER